MKFKFYTTPLVTAFILKLKLRSTKTMTPAVISCDKKKLVTYCSDLTDGEGFKCNSELKEFLNQDRVFEEVNLKVEQYLSLSEILICLDNSSDKSKIKSLLNPSKIKINNLSDYYCECKYVVAKFVEGDWWYYGSYDETNRAYEVALSENGMVFRAEDVIDGDY